MPGSIHFWFKRSRKELHRARFHPFLVQAVTQGALSCPVPSIFGSSGHARSSIVPSFIHFSIKRTRRKPQHARLHQFFTQVVTQEPPMCPAPSVFLSSGHAGSPNMPTPSIFHSRGNVTYSIVPNSNQFTHPKVTNQMHNQ